jgi:hypothetical protein
MAGIPKVKITFDADFDELKRGISGAQTEVSTFSSKLGKFGKAAGAAFAVAGAAAAAYAGKLLIDGVKSAIADEAAQAKLAKTLENVTGATEGQIAAVEAQILKTSLLTGKTDDELRPSFERLIRATKDSDEALKLQAVAIDVAAGSGKSLEAVSNAMAKAAEGNTASLVKLGVGLTAAQLKTMSMDEVTAALAKTFGGQAAEQADTFAGKMARLQVAFDEGKETVGSFVLDAITPMITFIVNNVIPQLSTLASTIGEKLQPTFAALSTYFTETLIPTFTAIWSFITDYLIPTMGTILAPVIEGIYTAFTNVSNAIKNNETNLAPLIKLFKIVATFVRDNLAPVIGTVLKTALTVVGDLVVGLINGFSRLVGIIGSVVSAIKSIIDLVRNNPIVKGIGGVIDSAFGGFRANGGSVSAGTPYVVGERGAELFVPKSNGTIVPNNALGGGSTTINLTVNGAIDAEGTARTIIDVLNRSNARGALGANRLQFSS